jgi:hypothetical protein
MPLPRSKLKSRRTGIDVRRLFDVIPVVRSNRERVRVG